MSYTIIHTSHQHTNNTQIISDCPYCGKDSHFYMNKNTGMWDCKKCGETGNYYKYVQYVKYGGIDGIKVLIKENFNLSKVDNIFEDKKSVEDFPTSFVSIKEGDKYYKYFTKVRKFKPELLDKYAVFNTLAYDENYYNRIVVPVADEKGIIKGYVG